MLPPDEAIRTSILSTDWRNLWKSADFVLDFDGMEYLAELYQTTSPISDIRVHLPEKRTLFKNRVNQILTQLYSCRVIKFRVAFNLTRDCNSNGEIDRWVRFAISKRLESLHLDLHIDNVGNVDYYVFSEDCYNHIKTPVGMSEIGSLRSLHLCFVDFRDEIFEAFVANCPLLEELVVKDSSLVTKMRVVGLSKLKHLEVRLCWFLRFIDIDCNPSLTRFVYEDCEKVEKFRVGKCPSLVDLTLVNSVQFLGFVFRSLSGLAHRLESLFLSNDVKFDTSIPYVAEHTRLQRLTIEIRGQDKSYRGLIPLINACPRLHTLQLFVSFSMMIIVD
ncbi:Putative F-box/LRR-repeat protein At5g02700 [Linum perenne]